MAKFSSRPKFLRLVTLCTTLWQVAQLPLHEIQQSPSRRSKTYVSILLDKAGDVSSIFDKRTNRELLTRQSAWLIRPTTRGNGPHGTWTSKTSSGRRGRLSKVATTIRVVERGPVPREYRSHARVGRVKVCAR